MRDVTFDSNRVSKGTKEVSMKPSVRQHLDGLLARYMKEAFPVEYATMKHLAEENYLGGSPMYTPGTIVAKFKQEMAKKRETQVL